MSLPGSIPRSLSPSASLVAFFAELRDAADTLAKARGLDARSTLTETRALLDAAAAALQRVHRMNQNQTPPASLLQAETFALRELAAARRHQELASRSPDTCRAACELALRSLLRAIDTLLVELIPNTLSPLP
jgi:hypothetical protein